MKLKLLLIGLALSVATVVAATKHAKAGAPKVTEKAAPAPTVKDTQVAEMQSITDGILAGAKSVSGPWEVFRFINGQEQINADKRETPLSGAITLAKAKGYTIVCYENSKVVAATDPSLLGKDASEFKASDGKIVLDLVVENLRNSSGDRAVFTYETPGTTLVNGKPSSHSLVVDAIGRKSFPFPSSADKYLVMVYGPIDL